mmetsp:Transcript_24303/g.72936  ORF Transcript_24303/g.72936 Transcript_24303/m.72936 type:complete len:106 (-) Transcript_24303:389-706(-)
MSLVDPYRFERLQRRAGTALLSLWTRTPDAPALMIEAAQPASSLPEMLHELIDSVCAALGSRRAPVVVAEPVADDANPKELARQHSFAEEDGEHMPEHLQKVFSV